MPLPPSLAALVQRVEGILADPDLQVPLSILKGFRNGMVYGAKVRFPHALVMTFLFRTGTLEEKARIIFKATKTHSKNLAFFVTIYKSLMLLQKHLAGDKEMSFHSFLAGLIGGYLVFGDDNGINQQMILYLFSRVMVALVKIPVKHGVLPKPKASFSIFAALTWAAVMWLFRHERDTLQPSLQASMQYLYLDSNHWKGLRTLLWHNK
ncbi:peroxisomal membrane protein 4 [Piptocephalis cylindrospora]|uniref:Peroxisomal membrane protein 4 n=1 Tax=Piptocephalis cylindrospora TaxID=1907219 RepID=A0A4P9Y5M6_9FUNG|nr:peroxisomal membrane protein 4 [Piptocephalis cylindrospora]|eukprot:RKP14022.1 peroxisomal membrane protein 4 [Piptocephalis cylindrospora]